ncbi:MAG: hypothetical protein ABMB14_36030 [Myxococcota bacterium]
MIPDETIRLNAYDEGQLPKHGWIEITVVADPDPVTAIERTKAVVRVVCDARSQPTWPAAEWWNRELPIWFRRSFDRSPSDVAGDDRVFSYESWIAALPTVGWEWWSTDASGPDWFVNLVATSEFVILEPLLYVIWTATGPAEGISISYREYWLRGAPRIHFT